ncbi:MAG: hypothetical protein HRT41_12860 [Campylobacteraceae bacterium]|nr:hypothetical protein [Campylobacteraceae bacterium]
MEISTYKPFLKIQEQISKEDLNDILDMAEQLGSFELAFDDYLEAIN